MEKRKRKEETARNGYGEERRKGKEQKSSSEGIVEIRKKYMGSKGKIVDQTKTVFKPKSHK